MHRGDGCFSLTSSWGAQPEGFGIKDRSQLGVFHWCPGRVNVLQNRIPVWKDLRHTFVVNLAKKMHASSCVNGASICHRLSQTAYCRCYRPDRVYSHVVHTCTCIWSSPFIKFWISLTPWLQAVQRGLKEIKSLTSTQKLLGHCASGNGV